LRDEEFDELMREEGEGEGEGGRRGEGKEDEAHEIVRGTRREC